jgi:hypothetical protein
MQPIFIFDDKCNQTFILKKLLTFKLKKSYLYLNWKMLLAFELKKFLTFGLKKMLLVFELKKMLLVFELKKMVLVFELKKITHVRNWKKIAQMWTKKSFSHLNWNFLLWLRTFLGHHFFIIMNSQIYKHNKTLLQIIRIQTVFYIETITYEWKLNRSLRLITQFYIRIQIQQNFITNSTKLYYKRNRSLCLITQFYI